MKTSIILSLVLVVMLLLASYSGDSPSFANGEAILFVKAYMVQKCLQQVNFLSENIDISNSMARDICEECNEKYLYSAEVEWKEKYLGHRKWEVTVIVTEYGMEFFVGGEFGKWFAYEETHSVEIVNDALFRKNGEIKIPGVNVLEPLDPPIYPLP